MSPLSAEYCLAPTPCVNAAHPAVLAFVELNRGESSATPRQQVVRLFYAVRDQFRYDPYRLTFTIEGMSASRVLENGYGHCIAKAVLLAACARAIGVPARLGYADVRNHLTTPRLRALMESDVFAWHGFTELNFDGKWVKATPAFDLALCERAGVIPLEFDGLVDSIYHPFDQSGRHHMEYVRNRGSYLDVPLDEILPTYLEMYPKAAKLYGQGAALVDGGAQFETEVHKESS
jgi:transglutaminase-like putative cysteine protease